MSDPIWKKSGKSAGPDAQVMEFLAGEDVVLDRELLLFDMQASAAHAMGLSRIGIFTDEENARVQAALRQLGEEFRSGERVLDTQFEDGHSAIEAWLTEMLGPAGARIHTGRSRNDQVAVALRLYMKDRLGRLGRTCLETVRVLLHRAEKERLLPMPGYTHLQRAMPSSAGLWLAGHAEGFLDDAELAGLTRSWLDASPLGTAAGFGVNLPLPRQEVSDALGFTRLAVNPQYAQNSRGKIELQALSALAAATLDLQRLAWDLSLFTTAEFGFVSLPERYCTGSSIMPNKNNPDVVELLRATHANTLGAQAELNAVLGLPSGYQRDLQATKPPLLRGFRGGLRALNLLPDLLGGFTWNEDRMRAALTPEMYATDRATRLAAGGMPFREAYRAVARDLHNPDTTDPDESLRERVSAGGCGNLGLDILTTRLKALDKEFER
jgi:argininosuccinate lyase